MNVMLLAAGEGTRLRPYTLTLPKPAIPFLTIPLAAHSLSFLRGIEISKLVVNTFHLHQKIHELFHSLPVKCESLHFSDEVGEILGSGGGIGKAREHLLGGGDFVMMNADEIILPKDPSALNKALEQHRKSQALATLMVMDHPGVGTEFGGVWADSNQKVLGFGKTAFPGSQKAWHFIGVLILSERVYNYITPSGPSNILYDALTIGIQKGELVQAFPFECTWFETGNPKDFIAATKQCLTYLTAEADSFQKKALLQTLNDFSSEPIKLQKTESSYFMISESAKIESSTTKEGIFVAGKGSSVGKDCRLKNVIVASGATVPANTEASDCLFL